MLRISSHLEGNWDPALVRPPGALPEKTFLSRCIKCGQCMRVCPTNVIHPAGLQAGIEGIWTPMLNFRMGTSGCQRGCIACGNLCPTAAIRPATVDGNPTVEIDEDLCMFCANCFSVCPALPIADADYDGVSIWVGGKVSNSRCAPKFSKLAVPYIPNEPPRWPSTTTPAVVPAWIFRLRTAPPGPGSRRP